MPVLTDRQEPDDADKPPDEDPNSYVLSYLFTQHRPAVELQRTGQVLILAGAGTNVGATLVLWNNQEFGFSWLLLLISLLIPVMGLAATYLVWSKRRGYNLFTGLSLLLDLAGLGSGWLALPFWDGLGYATAYYLPGVLVMTLGCAFIFFKP